MNFTEALIRRACLVHQLIHVAGVPEDEVASMSLARAIDVMAAHWSQPKQ